MGLPTLSLPTMRESSTPFMCRRDSFNNCIYLDPEKDPHEFTLIFLHGLGDEGSSYIKMFNK